MSPTDARLVLIAAECRRDWATVEAHLARARSVDPATGPAEAALVALSLDHAYQAFETVLRRARRSARSGTRGGSSTASRSSRARTSCRSVSRSDAPAHGGPFADSVVV